MSGKENFAPVLVIKIVSSGVTIAERADEILGTIFLSPIVDLNHIGNKILACGTLILC